MGRASFGLLDPLPDDAHGFFDEGKSWGLARTRDLMTKFAANAGHYISAGFDEGSTREQLCCY